MNRRARVDALRHAMAAAGVDLCVLVSPQNQIYLTGFRTIYYPRPVLVVVEPEATTLVVPRCDEHEARATAEADRIVAYGEQPGDDGPSSELACLEGPLALLPAGSTVGVETRLCPLRVGQELGRLGLAVADVGDILLGARARKDADELELVRRAAALVEIATAASLEAVAAGTTELAIDEAGNVAACEAAGCFADASTLELFVITAAGSERTIHPHTMSTTRRLARGDVVSHSRQVGVAGYRAEIERTAFVGRPTGEQVRVFDAVRRAQEAAVAELRPGTRCGDVDLRAREILAAEGLDAYALHRSGHGLGLGTEWPSLAFDNPRPLEEGMILSVEPAVYVPGLGGFRHSDTFLVTAGGAERLTSMPTDLESLTFG